MGRVIHRYQAFESLEEAKRFRRENGGLLLDQRRRSDRLEYTAIRANGLDTDRYPHIVVWNELED